MIGSRPMPLSAPSVVANEARAADVLADQRATRLIQPEAAILFGNVRADQAEVRRFLDQLARQFPVVLFEFVDARR